ncbi:hypothetical protein HK104_008136, partial [Borealophlyctis nickersoniae]
MTNATCASSDVSPFLDSASELPLDASPPPQGLFDEFGDCAGGAGGVGAVNWGSPGMVAVEGLFDSDLENLLADVGESVASPLMDMGRGGGAPSGSGWGVHLAAAQMPVSMATTSAVPVPSVSYPDSFWGVPAGVKNEQRQPSFGFGHHPSTPQPHQMAPSAVAAEPGPRPETQYHPVVPKVVEQNVAAYPLPQNLSRPVLLPPLNPPAPTYARIAPAYPQPNAPYVSPAVSYTSPK